MFELSVYCDGDKFIDSTNKMNQTIYLLYFKRKMGLLSTVDRIFVAQATFPIVSVKQDHQKNKIDKRKSKRKLRRNYNAFVTLETIICYFPFHCFLI